MHIPKWLIATAGLLFVVLIAAVAFFIGRQSSQPLEATIAVSAPEPEDPVAEESGAAMRSPITASTSGTAATEAPPSIASASLSRSSAPAAAVDTPQATAEARARVSAYFQQMEALQPGGPIASLRSIVTRCICPAGPSRFPKRCWENAPSSLRPRYGPASPG